MLLLTATAVFSISWAERHHPVALVRRWYGAAGAPAEPPSNLSYLVVVDVFPRGLLGEHTSPFGAPARRERAWVARCARGRSVRVCSVQGARRLRSGRAARHRRADGGCWSVLDGRDAG